MAAGGMAAHRDALADPLPEIEAGCLGLLDDVSELPEFEAFRGLRAELITRLEKVQGSKLVCILSALQSDLQKIVEEQDQ